MAPEGAHDPARASCRMLFFHHNETYVANLPTSQRPALSSLARSLANHRERLDSTGQVQCMLACAAPPASTCSQACLQLLACSLHHRWSGGRAWPRARLGNRSRLPACVPATLRMPVRESASAAGGFLPPGAFFSQAGLQLDSLPRPAPPRHACSAMPMLRHCHFPPICASTSLVCAPIHGHHHTPTPSHMHMRTPRFSSNEGDTALQVIPESSIHPPASCASAPARVRASVSGMPCHARPSRAAVRLHAHCAARAPAPGGRTNNPSPVADVTPHHASSSS